MAVFDGGQLTYRQLDQASDRLAANLASAGISPRDRGALQLPNIPQFLISKATSRPRVSPKNRTGRVVPGGDAQPLQTFHPHGIQVHPKRASG